MPVAARRKITSESSSGKGEQAFTYAKACGIIAKSFVGKRISALRELRSFKELDRLLFPELRRDIASELSDRELLVDLERRIEKRAINKILSIVNVYAEPPELLVRQLGVYEYSDLKTCLHHITEGVKPPPSLCDIGRFRTIRFEAYPDLDAMLRGTAFSFLLSKDIKNLRSDSADFAQIEIELDTRYYLGLTKSLGSLSDDDRLIAQKILFDEISLRNCVWALRLRTYFRKNAAETAGYLMTLRTQVEGAKNFTAAALKSLNLPLDSRAPWQGWKWEKFLNPEKQGEHWNLNPRHFQNAASQYLYRLALTRFHHAPMAVSSIFCFIKLVQSEENLLTSIIEGLNMGMGAADVFDLLEVPV